MKFWAGFLIKALFFTAAFKQCAVFAQTSALTVTDRGSYYDIILDYTTGISHYQMGRQIAQKLLEKIPNLEQMSDKYLADKAFSQAYYEAGITRMKDVAPQVPQEYLDEIAGISSIICSGSSNIMNDGKLSQDEIYTAFLSDAVLGATDCSGVSVFGPRSANGSSITARLHDNYDNAENYQALTQSVITIKNKNHSICMIGSLSIGTGTGFNDEGIFIALHSSLVDHEYSSQNKRSYIMDVRYALENFSTSDEIASFFTDNSKKYVSDNLIQITDKYSTRILENNFSGTGTNIRCALRSDTSALNPGVTWEFPNSIATANSFVLAGNYDNHTMNSYATERWKSAKTLLKQYGDKITFDEMKLIASYDKGDGPGLQANGDLYNMSTLQITVFQPDNFHLEVAFRPRTGILPEDPIFEEIPVHIGKISLAEEPGVVPNKFNMQQNYPNPFNPSTNIGYSIVKSGFVSLKVYDILGNEIGVLVSEEKPAGNYSVTFNAAGLSSGIYLYTINAGTYNETRKMVLSK